MSKLRGRMFHFAAPRLEPQTGRSLVSLTRRPWCVWLAGLLVVAAAPFASAQITGDLQVNVADPTNSAVPNATVTVKSLETGTTRTATTGVVGSVSINQLAVGNYEVTVSHDGFATTTTQGAVVGGTSNTISLTLNVAAAAQQIEVTGTAEIINTVNAQLQQTTERNSIANLPMVVGGVLVFVGGWLIGSG